MTDTDKENMCGNGWRYAEIWLAIVLGTAVSLCLTGHKNLVMTPYSPLVLTLGSAALIGLSSICVWGLVFSLPMYFLFRSWLRRAIEWWRVLPIAGILMSMISTLGMTLMGVKMPMLDELEGAEEGAVPSEEALDKSFTIMSEAWRTCGRAMLILAVALLLCMVLAGWKRSCTAIASHWRAFRDYSRRMKAESKAEEEAKAAAKAAEAAAKAETADVAK